MEEFKPIPGSKYSVSNLGKVRNDTTDRILCVKQSREGYCSVGIYLDNKRHHVFVHRLVAQVWLDQNGRTEVDHINRIKSDNRLVNLRWVDHTSNMGNLACYKSNKLGQKNIDKYKSGFRVRIVRRGTCLFQSYFNSLQDAVNARDAFLKSLKENL